MPIGTEGVFNTNLRHKLKGEKGQRSSSCEDAVKDLSRSHASTANWSVEKTVQEFSKKTLGDEQDREAVTPKYKLR